MVDPLEPDDGVPVLPPGPRRSTYTPPPADARYLPGSLTRDAVPMPTGPSVIPPQLDELEEDPEPESRDAPERSPVPDTTAEPSALESGEQESIEPQSGEPESGEPPAASAQARVIWRVESTEPDVAVADEPVTSVLPREAFEDALVQDSAPLGPGVPPPPSRLSLSDSELAAVIDPAAAPPGSTAELIDLFEQQLTLRAEEAQRLTLWERAVRESGVPHADELVESVRSGFTGLIDVVPPAVDDGDPWARYPGESAPPAPLVEDRAPIVLPPLVVSPTPVLSTEVPSTDVPETDVPSGETPSSEAPVHEPTLAEALATFPPPFGLVPSAVVPPPSNETPLDEDDVHDGSQTPVALEPTTDGDPQHDHGHDQGEGRDEVAVDPIDELADELPPPLVEPEARTGPSALEQLFLASDPLADEPIDASDDDEAADAASADDASADAASGDAAPADLAPADLAPAERPRPTAAAPIGAPTGPIFTNPAAVAAAALGFDELLRASAAAPEEPARAGSAPTGRPAPMLPAAPILSPAEPPLPAPAPSDTAVTGSSRAVPVVDSGARSDPPALRVEASALEPTPVALRAGRSIRLFWLWFAVSSSVVSVGLGGVLVGLGMSLRQAILSGLLGVAASFLPLGLGTLAGKWSGQPTMVVSRASFGIVGNLLPALLAVVTRLLWAAVLLGMLGAGIASGLRAAGIAASVDPLVLSGALATVGLVVAAVIAGLGYGMIARVAAVASALSGALVVLIIVLTAPALDMSSALAIPDGDWALVVTGAVIVFSVVGLAWANSSGDLARYQAKATIGAGAVLSASIGATLPAFVLVAWGAALASSSTELAAALTSDPIGAIAGILPAGLAVPLVLAVALSLLVAAALALYSGGFALLSAGVRTSRPIGVLIGVVLTGAIAVPLVAAAPSFEVLLRDVLTTVAVPVAAWAGIFGAETMIRTRRVHSPSLLQSGGVYPPVRWVNTIALVVITIVGWGFTSATLAGLDAQGYLWSLTGTTGLIADSDAGVALALVLGLLTPIAVGIPAVRRLQEAESRAALDS